MHIPRAGGYPCTPTGLKRGVGPFVRDCGRERFALPKTEASQQTEMQGGWDDHPASLWHFRPPASGFSRGFAFGKMPRARARQGVRKYSRIKGGGRKRPPPESHRPATRVVSRALTFWTAGIKDGRLGSLRTSQVVWLHLKPAWRNGFEGVPAGCTSGIMGQIWRFWRGFSRKCSSAKRSRGSPQKMGRCKQRKGLWKSVYELHHC